MAIIEELIRKEDNGTISFGNYMVDDKKKLSGFDVDGDLYKIKTHKAMTKLEKNDKMLMEVVPGATVHNFSLTEKGATFSLEGTSSVQMTLELDADTEYKIMIDDVTVGKTKTNMSGKISIGAELTDNATPSVKFEKV